MNEDTNQTEFSETFASDIAAEIGGELFSKTEAAEGGASITEKSALGGEEHDFREEASKEKPVVQNNVVEGAVVPGQNSVAKALPKSWKKDMAPLWEKADPALHDYVYAREADVARGIQMYGEGHQRWNTLIEPFQGVLQANPGVDPVGIMQNLMQSHLALVNPRTPPAEKAKMAQRLLAEYGIDLSGVEKTPAETQFSDTIHLLNQKISQLESKLTQRERFEHESGVASQTKTVEAFFSDPSNEFAEEVGNDILRFIQTGAAVDLKSAYELACYANPVVRAKVLAKQQTPPPVVKRKTNGQFINLDTPDDAPLNRSKKSLSMDATADSIAAKYLNSH